MRWRALAIWLLLVAGAWQALLRTPVSSDMGLFLPASSSQDEELAIREIQGGPAGRLILIAIQGDDDQRLARASRELAARLRKNDQFSRVDNGEFRPPSGDSPLFRYRYLLGAGVCDPGFGAEPLAEALRARLDELASPLAPIVKQDIPADPTACFRSLLNAWRPQNAPPRHLGVWFSAAGDRALLIAQTCGGGGDLESQASAISGIRDAFAQGSDADGLRLELSGPGAFAVASRQIIHDETRRLSLIAALFVGAVLLYSFRSVRLFLLGGLPLAAGLIGGIAAVGLAFGGIHAITIAFGVTLLGVAVDYPIHAFSHWPADQPLEKAIRTIWPTLRLGMATSLLGYLALWSREFPGLSQLALFTASGLLMAAVTTRWLLPTLAGQRVSTRRAGICRALPGGSRLGALFVAVLATLAAAQLVSGGLDLQPDLARLSPIPESQISLDRELRHELGAPEVGRVLLITAGDAESALRESEKLRPRLDRLIAQGALGDYQMAARYLPSLATQERRKKSLPDGEQLRTTLGAALEDTPFRPEAFEPFLASVADSRQLDPLTPGGIVDTLLGARVSGLLYPADTGWNAIVPLIGVKDPEAVAATLAGLPEDRVHLLDLKGITDRIMGRFLRETLSKLAWLAGAILTALAIGLRDWRRLVRVAVPVGAVVVLDLGFLSALGIDLTLFHLVSLLLVLGLATDYTLFFSREESRQPDEARRTTLSLVTCALTTFTMFAILASSDIPVLRAIGITVSAGVAFAFFVGWLVSSPMPVRAIPTEVSS